MTMNKIIHETEARGRFPGSKVETLDEKGAGGAHHKYRITVEGGEPVEINFQHGAVLEVGANGIQTDHLLMIVINQLKDFQAGPYPSRDSAIALTHLETCLLWVNKRTDDRLKRGVEGRSQP